MRTGAADDGLGHGFIRKNVDKPVLYTIPVPAAGALAFRIMEGLQ
jgi:hypothetical protein